MSLNSKSCKAQHSHGSHPKPSTSSRSRPVTTVPIPKNLQSDSKIKNPEIAYVFNPRRDDYKEYHLDGDSGMYTDTALAQRAALKSAPTVVSSIQDFMNLYKENLNGGISKGEYESMQTKLCRLLRPGIPLEEMHKVIDEDWERDTKGAGVLSKESLFESLFELCDVWCPGIDEDQYKTFFEQLRFRLRYEGHQNQSAYDILR